MPIYPLDRLLSHAADKGYAVGAFVSPNIEVIQAAIAAAEASDSPVIIRIHPSAREVTRFDTLAIVARHLAAEAAVPVGLSLDHGDSLADTVDAIRAGCTSVMLDAAEKPLEENIRLVRQVVEVAKPLGIMVEASIGHMEYGAVQTADDFADVEQAVRLVRESGATILAPAIGNVHGSAHGEVKAKPNLNIARIAELRRATSAIICMHGGSGTPRDQMQAATKAGVSLVIMFSDIITAFNEAIQEVFRVNSSGISITDALAPAQRAAQAVIEEKMIDLGSAGQGLNSLREARRGIP